MNVAIYDTTLRDGCQGAGISLALDGVPAEEDANLPALLAAETPAVAIVAREMLLAGRLLAFVRDGGLAPVGR